VILSLLIKTFRESPQPDSINWLIKTNNVDRKKRDYELGDRQVLDVAAGTLMQISLRVCLIRMEPLLIPGT